MDGYFAVVLWQDYRRSGNRRALETLLAYNVTDTVNLENLMVRAYNMKVRDTAFEATHNLPVPPRPEVPFRADRATVSRLMRRMRGF